MDQRWLPPPSVVNFVPPYHGAHFVRGPVREQLALSTIPEPYAKDEWCDPLYYSTLMTATQALLVQAFKL